MLRPRVIVLLLFLPGFVRGAPSAMELFKNDIQPMLEEHCYSCHGDGNEKGGVVLDHFTDEASLKDHKLWLRVLKNTRSKIMPPIEDSELAEHDIEKLATWIKRQAFELDPAVADPGRVTLRRLNRIEYRNTIQELFGYHFDTLKEFPADDTGHGFDNIGDVLTVSPMLFERFIDAAQSIVSAAVPTQSRIVAENAVVGRRFTVVRPESRATLAADQERPLNLTTAKSPAGIADNSAPFQRPVPVIAGEALDLSYYTPVAVVAKHRIDHAGRYQLLLNLQAVERHVSEQFDYNRCQVVFKADGQTLLEREFVREGDKSFKFTFDVDWQAGEHELTFEVRPLAPDRDQIRLLRLRINAVIVKGPLAKEHWVQPAEYVRFFPRPVPDSASEREVYARGILGTFARRALRRPVDGETIDRLVNTAMEVSRQPDFTFEAGVAQAMVVVLASPRFLFREEDVLPLKPGEKQLWIDEYSLASRLSYFFWSSMPDDRLFALAAEGRLRANLHAEVDRMLADPRSGEFVRNFTGQWLQARDIEQVQINSLEIQKRELSDPVLLAAFATSSRIMRIPSGQRTVEQQTAFASARAIVQPFVRTPRPQLTSSLRQAMREETEMTFAYVLKEDRSLVELIESDYTFLNEELASHYGISGVEGDKMRRVQLPSDSLRGGVLTQGTVLAVTSNPTRTSPVKRGVFILEKILGTPPAPPPPNIPALEDVASKEELAKMTLRETLDLHAKNRMCRSCHNRMDPLGLALENFNALGRYREAEMGQPVESGGQLITGEKFSNIRDLKRILAHEHRKDFFHNLAEKLLTYALGRGVEYTDTDTLDQLVAKLEAADGRPSALLHGIVESAAFQQRRINPPVQTADHLPVRPAPSG